MTERKREQERQTERKTKRDNYSPSRPQLIDIISLALSPVTERRESDSEKERQTKRDISTHLVDRS